MSDVFISYARSDREIAGRFATTLEQAGWSVWWDREIHFGLPFDAAIEDALKSAACVVVLWSAASVNSDWVRTESGEGKRRGILVPVLIENASIPLEFRRLQTASLVGWPDVPHKEEIAKLLAAIGHLVRVREPASADALEIRQPSAAGTVLPTRPEEKESVDATGHAAIRTLLSNTYDQWLAGALSHLSHNPGEVARTHGRDEFIDYLNREKGTWLRAACRVNSVADDEFLVAAQAPYVMTNRTLYVFRDGTVSGPVVAITLEDVASYSTKGWWSKTLCFVLKSGETIELANMEQALKEEYVVSFLR